MEGTCSFPGEAYYSEKLDPIDTIKTKLFPREAP